MRAAAPIDSLSCAASAQVARTSAREEGRGAPSHAAAIRPRAVVPNFDSSI
ncbi:hypothetical protein F511_47738 [Dorcoceras hygrometricum]|uniref:Uncharacterized protein n=1 Tax=Dorcoceras hygrometricum TaxID=472368 RepID=A0A2Z6ZQC8_9LAMI|nr:hypothetical protein F511_47738 [Dorcoceras hygrometricum]